jgi:hypothetical protein
MERRKQMSGDDSVVMMVMAHERGGWMMPVRNWNGANKTKGRSGCGSRTVRAGACVFCCRPSAANDRLGRDRGQKDTKIGAKRT